MKLRRLLYLFKVKVLKRDDCEYDYHKHLTLSYGDGFFDVWTCDECGKEAICTGDLINHGAEMAAKRLLRVAQEGALGCAGFSGELMNQCAQEIIRLLDILPGLKAEVLSLG